MARAGTHLTHTHTQLYRIHWQGYSSLYVSASTQEHAHEERSRVGNTNTLTAIELTDQLLGELHQDALLCAHPFVSHSPFMRLCLWLALLTLLIDHKPEPVLARFVRRWNVLDCVVKNGCVFLCCRLLFSRSYCCELYFILVCVVVVVVYALLHSHFILVVDFGCKVSACVRTALTFGFF